MAEVVNIADYKNSKYKTNQGVFLLRGLFYETTTSDKSTVLYTLKDQDHAGYPSLRRLYLETSDPTEYFFATHYLDGWAQWERLCECDWFISYIERWRRELELNMRAKALMRIVYLSQQPGKEAFNANKFLLTSSWSPSRSKVGRPPKDDIKEKAAEELEKQKEVSEDAKRLADVLTTDS